MAIVAYSTRTLPNPTATYSDGFVFLLNEDWLSSGDAGDPFTGVNAFALGGGDVKIFANAPSGVGKQPTNQLPIHVIDFVTGVSPKIQIWLRRPTWTAGDTVTIGKDDTQTVQPLPSTTYGSEAVYVGSHIASIDGSTDSTGNTTQAQTDISGGADFNGIQSARFNGSTSRIDTAVNGLQYPFTLSCWVNINVGAPLISVGDSSVPDNFHRVAVISADNTVRADTNDGTLHRAIGGNPAAGWNFCVAVFDSSSSRTVYLNGGGAAQNTETATNNQNNIDRVTFGTDSDSTPFSFFDGDACLFNVAKSGYTSARIADEYTNQSDPSNFGTGGAYTLVGVAATSDIAITTPAPSFSVTSSATLPAPSSDINYTINAPTFSISSDVSLPNPQTSIDYSIASPVFSIESVATLPNPATSIDVEIQSPLFSIQSSVTQPGYNSTISFDIDKPIFSVESSVSLPSPLSVVELDITKPVFKVRAFIGGLEIVAGTGATIIYEAGSNKNKLKAESNNINLITGSNILIFKE